MWSFVIALAHFVSETFVYKTAKLGPGMISPLIVACERSTFTFTELARLVLTPFLPLSLTDSFKPCRHVPPIRSLSQQADRVDLIESNTNRTQLRRTKHTCHSGVREQSGVWRGNEGMDYAMLGDKDDAVNVSIEEQGRRAFGAAQAVAELEKGWTPKHKERVSPF